MASGCQALGLADTADRGGDAASAPWIAPRLELPKQQHRAPAAGVPALQELGLIGMEQAPPIVATVRLHRARRQAQMGERRGAGMAQAPRPPQRATALAAGAPWHGPPRGPGEAWCRPGPGLPPDAGVEASGPRPGSPRLRRGERPRQRRLTDPGRSLPPAEAPGASGRRSLPCTPAGA